MLCFTLPTHLCVVQMVADDDAKDMSAEDEEVEREFWLLTIRLAIVKCVDLMVSLRSVSANSYFRVLHLALLFLGSRIE